MRTRFVRSASTATGSVKASAAAPAMATISRMPALVRWKASRMFGVSTLKALWVAWSSSSIAKSTPRGNREAPAPSWARRLTAPPPRSTGGCRRRGAGAVGAVASTVDRPVAQVVAEAGQPAGEEDEHDEHAEGGGEQLPARRQVDRAALDDGGAEDGAEGRPEPADGGRGEHDEAGRHQERRLLRTAG